MQVEESMWEQASREPSDFPWIDTTAATAKRGRDADSKAEFVSVVRTCTRARDWPRKPPNDLRSPTLPASVIGKNVGVGTEYSLRSGR